MASAHTPSTMALPRTRQVARGKTLTRSRRTTQAQAITSDSAISRPGKMPARKSWVIETLAATPKMMKPMDGGITGAMMPPAAISPAERGTL